MGIVVYDWDMPLWLEIVAMLLCGVGTLVLIFFVLELLSRPFKAWDLTRRRVEHTEEMVVDISNGKCDWQQEVEEKGE